MITPIIHPTVEIKHYELVFKPYEYKALVEGIFEVDSEFRFPPRSLLVFINIKDQEINTHLDGSHRDNCRIYRKYTCRVYRFTSLLPLNTSEFFRNRISDWEEVPVFITLKFNQEYSTILKKLNYLWDESILYTLIDELNLLKIFTKFNYKNYFEIERLPGSSSIRHLDIPTMWIFDNRNESITKERIILRLNNYDLMDKDPIREWFSIKKNRLPLLVKHLNNSIHLSNNQVITDNNFRIKDSNTWTTYSITNSLTKNIDNTYSLSEFNSGIFIPEKLNGFINSVFVLTVGNNQILLNIKNHFNFTNNYSVSTSKPIRIGIKSITNAHFKDLSNFKFIDF